MLIAVIALAAAGAVAILTLQAYERLTYRSRIVSARIASHGGRIPDTTPLLFRERRGRLPLLGLPRLSAAAAERITGELERAGWQIRAGEYLALRAALAAAAGGAAAVMLTFLRAGVFPVTLAAILGMFAGWMGPQLYLRHSRRRRFDQLERQLPDALTAIAKSLGAGTGLRQALAYAANETPPPLGPELQGTVRDLQLGVEADDAFTALSARIGSPDLDIAVTAIVIQRAVGGNLAEVLTSVTESIRERARLKGEIRVMTSRQQISSAVTALVPVVTAVLYVIINPKAGALLFFTTPGQIALAAAIGFEVLGLALVHRLSIVDV